MRPTFALLAPDEEVYPGQRQTRGRVHRPDNGNPTHRMPVICIGRVRGFQTTLFASSKVGAAPQTWYRGTRPIIATKPCSLMMVSTTATTRHDSVSVQVVVLFFKFASLTSRPRPLQSFFCVFYENIGRPSRYESGCTFFYGEGRSKFPKNL